MGVTRTYTLKGDRDKVYSRVVKKMESESSLVKAGAVSDGLDCTPSVGYRKMRICYTYYKGAKKGEPQESYECYGKARFEEVPDNKTQISVEFVDKYKKFSIVDVVSLIIFCGVVLLGVAYAIATYLDSGDVSLSLSAFIAPIVLGAVVAPLIRLVGKRNEPSSNPSERLIELTDKAFSELTEEVDEKNRNARNMKS